MLVSCAMTSTSLPSTNPMTAIAIQASEAQILSRYLIGENCSDEIAQHYAKALDAHQAIFTTEQQITWNRMLCSLLYLRLVDSGLAVVNAQSALRKRIFIMLCLLETTPEYTRYYLPQERSILYLIPLGFRLAWSAICLVVGVVLVKVAKLNS